MGMKVERLDRFIDALLLGIENRGKDATGIIAVTSKDVPELCKADVPASTFVKWRQPLAFARYRTILGHTRAATQGKPENLDNNHPIQSGTCFAIHNGHITNDDELFAEHSLVRLAQVDSEVIPALVAKYGLDNAKEALEQFEGGMATALIDPSNFPGMTVLAKGLSSPIEVLETKYGWVWASSAEAIRRACQEVLGFTPALSKIETLQSGEMLVMNKGELTRMEFKPKTRTYSYSTDTWSRWSGPRAITTGTSTYTHWGWDDECNSCGCKRLWHGSGDEMTGACRHVIPITTGGEFTCRCIGFVEQKEKQLNGIEFCDGCGREFPIGDLDWVTAERSFLCRSCKPLVIKEGPTTEELRKRAEFVLSAQINVADELEEGDEFSSAAWAAREDEMHKQTLAMVAKTLDLNVKFVEWLIIDATTEILNSDDYLTDNYVKVYDAYYEYEPKLRQAVTNADVERWRAGDYQRVPGTEFATIEDGANVVELFPSCEVEEMMA
jgi:hypothetical protein